MKTSYADTAQARQIDERMLGSELAGIGDNWLDDSATEFFAGCQARERKRLATLPGRLQIAMGQMESVLATQGGSK